MTMYINLTNAFKYIFLKIFPIFSFVSLILITGCSKGDRYNNEEEKQKNISLMTASSSLNWSIINVAGDAHLIKINNDTTILIDTGSSETAETSLIPYIKASSIDSIDLVFISHPHLDHYGGLISLISTSVTVGSVYFNMPTNERCNSEPWGCSSKDLENILDALKQKNIPINNIQAGTNISLSPDTNLNILYAFNLTNSPVGYIDLNDESLIMLLQHKNHRFLFTGDLNSKIGTYLADYGLNIQADVLKIPHHGTAGIAPNIFFEKVNPLYTVVPSEYSLWCSERSVQARNWVNEKKITTYISGFHGNINIAIQDDKLNFTTQYINPDVCN